MSNDLLRRALTAILIASTSLPGCGDDASSALTTDAGSPSTSSDDASAAQDAAPQVAKDSGDQTGRDANMADGRADSGAMVSIEVDSGASTEGGRHDAGSDASSVSLSDAGSDTGHDASSATDAATIKDAGQDATDSKVDSATDDASGPDIDATPGKVDAGSDSAHGGADAADLGDAAWLAADASAADPEVVDAIITQKCPASTDTNMCFRCEDERCCNTYAAYAANSEAIAFKSCYAACEQSSGPNTLSCAEQCDTQHPKGTPDWARREACLSLYCFDSNGCGNESLDACTTCLNAKCARESVSLAYTSPGYLLQGCIAECEPSDMDCQTACLSRYPDAVRDLWRLDDCSKANCSSCAK